MTSVNFFLKHYANNYNIINLIAPNRLNLLFLMPISNNMKITIGKQIKALLKNKGVSQEAVADYLNISQSAYSRIENGNSHSWACYVEKICIYFQVNPEYLVATIITLKTVVSEPNGKNGGAKLMTIMTRKLRN